MFVGFFEAKYRTQKRVCPILNFYVEILIFYIAKHVFAGLFITPAYRHCTSCMTNRLNHAKMQAFWRGVRLIVIPASEPDSPLIKRFSRIAFHINYAVCGYREYHIHKSRYHIFAVFIRKDGLAIRV